MPQEVPDLNLFVISTSASISLGRQEPFEVRAQETASDGTRTKQWQPVHAQATSAQKRDFHFAPQLPNLSLKREPGRIFGGDIRLSKLPFEHLL